MGKALQPLINAFDAQKAKMPSTEQMAKPLLAFAAAAKAQEHEIADKIRDNEKKNQEAASEKDIFYTFKTENDNILKYCIEKDPSADLFQYISLIKSTP